MKGLSISISTATENKNACAILSCKLFKHHYGLLLIAGVWGGTKVASEFGKLTYKWLSRWNFACGRYFRRHIVATFLHEHYCQSTCRASKLHVSPLRLLATNKLEKGAPLNLSLRHRKHQKRN